MPDIFVNYRTGDAERSATTIERELSHRFGEDRVFYASKSIDAGSLFGEELLRNVRRSSVLLAVIGSAWTASPALRNADDWVRREILEAFTCGITVIPILDGRTVERLRPADLPLELRRLADCQSIRVDLQHNARADLARIGDRLADLVPALRAAQDAKGAPADPGGVDNSTGQVGGPATQARDISGDVGVIVKDTNGPVHTGTGDLHHNSTHFTGDALSGDGATYIAGDNRGGVRHQFGAPRPRRDRDQ
jgi:TIR domain